MDDKPLVSVVTVVFNEVDNIKFTLDNIASLKEKIELEYIVIDGESTDGTTEVIKKYSSIIDKFICEKDKGIYDAMNKGIQLAQGEYIGLLNAGDTYIESAIENVFKLINNTDFDVIYGGINILDEERNLIKVQKGLSPSKMFSFGISNLNHPSFFIKKTVYQDLGYYSLNYDTAGDFEFAFKAYVEGYKYQNTNKIHANFLKGGASYLRSPYQKIRIYKKYINKETIWAIGAILKYLIFKYPLYFLVKILPKNVHYKYLKFKYKIFNKS
ncbi:glycosyltransferase family 2 protein [Fodinibius sp. AD559]|uniref:glycosyltransferase family 2 protein n=1 Tax=Fodinibius sp. AD559 TaxID=3424179 RepID=UPI0040469E59